MRGGTAVVAHSYARRMLLVLAGASVLLGSAGRVFSAGPPSPKDEAHADLKTIVIPVEGMVCFACAATVKKAVKSLEGVRDVEVSLEKRTAKVTYAAHKLSADRIVAAINQAGYRAGLPKEAE
jgi:mercuric ion binding protein